MARLNHVKHARPRFKTVPILDEDNNPVMRTLHREDGTPKTNRRGEPIQQRVTKPDLTQPLPNHKCGRCGDEIKPGDGYLWWANKLPGSRSGYKQRRCMKPECYPSIAERTPGRAGQWMGMEADFEKMLADAESVEDLQSVVEDIAGQIEEFGQEFIDGAENMESGFGHETEQSANLRERGDNIVEQAEEIRNLDIEEFDEDEPEWDEDDVRETLLVSNFDNRTEDQLDDAEQAQLKEMVDEREAEHESEHSDWESSRDGHLESLRERIQDEISNVDVYG